MEIWIAGALALAIASSVQGGTGGFRSLSQGDLSCAYLHLDVKWDPAAIQILDTLHGRVLTDWPDLLLRSEPFSTDFIEMGILDGMRLDGRFDDSALLAAIRSHAYSAIVLDSDSLEREYRRRAMLWPSLKQAIAESYRLVPSSGPPYIMLPAGAETSAPKAGH